MTRSSCQGDTRPSQLTRRANEVLGGPVEPNKRWKAVADDLSDGFPIEVTCPIVCVSVSGIYMWKHRKPAARSVRHAMVADVMACTQGDSLEALTNGE